MNISLMSAEILQDNYSRNERCDRIMITSTSNAQIKNIIQLQTKAKARNRQKCFVVEGIRMYMEVPEENLVKTYVSADFFDHVGDLVKARIMTADYELVETDVFKRISDTMTPQGILAVVKKKKEILLKDMVESGRLFVILEDIQDPGNLGTIIRTAEGAGVSGVIMSSKTVDIYNSKVVRSTMGSIFRVPFIYVDNLENAADLLKGNGIRLYAAHLMGSKHYFEMDYRKPAAFMIGNEGNGLSDAAVEMADELIKIPMFGEIESLNAASAATILMYESLRQNLS